MATACIPQLRFEGEHFPKPITARFDVEHASTDGGALVLKAVDAALGLTAAMAGGIYDRREPGKIQQPLVDLIRQRVFGLACGYTDCNDAARVADDAIHKLLVDRDPLAGAALGSQPTLSRLENAVRAPDVYRLTETLADTVIAIHRRRRRGRTRLITIDVDPTDDPTHGQQEFAFFNGHYDTWSYLPLVGALTFDDEREQYVVGAVLRPGNSSARGTRPLLTRLFAKLRGAFPRARLRVRLDAGFAGEALLTFLEAEAVEYVVSVAPNRTLDKRARRLMGRVRALSRASGRSERLFGETRYAARRWSRPRRVILKAEVVQHPGREPKNNPRFVVTNLSAPPAEVYEIYCARGDMENRIKELKHGVAVDRTSCSRFRANAFRVLLAVAAYVLLQELRRAARGTRCADAQVSILRERLLKVAAWVECSVRRVVVHLPRSFPWLRPWRQIACAVGAMR
jgi:hypothetical protein